MTQEKLNKKFGMYLKGVIGPVSIRKLVQRVQKLCPDDRAMQISQPYLTGILHGDKPPPSPPKLKALALATGENYETMLFHAGYLDRDPTASPRTWDKETHLDLFLNSLMEKPINVPEELKQALEEALIHILELLTGPKASQQNLTKLSEDILKRAYLEACELGPLSEVQRKTINQNIDGLIQMARSWGESDKK